MGRGSASLAVAAAALLMVMMAVQAEGCNGKKSPPTFIVGGKSGWNFMCNSWPGKQRFRPGDFLQFNYDNSFHNVIVVDKQGYESCEARLGRSRTYNSGKDRIRLHRGMNYFICGTPTHCQSAGMKIVVNAY